MANSEIKPHRIKNPIQFLAAVLLALGVLLPPTFIGAASILVQPSWAAPAFVVASLLYPGVCLIFLTALLTKFRSQLQDDEYCSQEIKNALSNKSKKLENQLTNSGLSEDALLSGQSVFDLNTEEREKLNSTIREFEVPLALFEARGLELDETNSTALLQYGKSLLANREWRRAARYLDKYIIEKQSDWYGHFLAGIAHGNSNGGTKENIAALVAYSNGLLLAPDDLDKNRVARLLSYRAAMLKRLHKFDDAIKDLTEAEGIASNYYEAHDIKYNLACIYAMKGDRASLLRMLEELKGASTQLAQIEMHKNNYFKKFKDDPEFLQALSSAIKSSTDQ